MNKTIIINIGNTILHIEEEAFEILTSYLNEIKQHFTKNADDFEIVKDIENRIAEMFAEILSKKQNQVIEVSDVRDVMTQMGSVKDFNDETEEESPLQSPSDYFSGKKKLYRDVYEGIFAGVCSGLSHYFNIEVRWMRLLFFLLSFAGGIGILVYLILWIAMPSAVTRSERMEMKGEATNLYGYKRSFEEELAVIRANMKSAGEQFGPLAQSSSNLVSHLFTTITRLVTTIARLLGKAIAWFIIIFGICALLALIIGLGALIGFWNDSFYNDFPFNIINTPFKAEIVLSVFISIFIPFLALVLFAIKTINQHLQINKYIWFSLLVVWLFGTATLSYNIARIVSEFKEEAELAQKTDLKNFSIYVFNVNPGMVFSHEDSLNLKIKDYASGSNIVIDNREPGAFKNPRNVRIRFEKSDDNKASITKSYKANGKTFSNALENAQNIEYQYSITDSIINLNPGAILKKQAVWRDQNVLLTVRVPIGTKININNNLYKYLAFYHYCAHDNDRHTNYITWTMTEEGLKCQSDIDIAEENNANQ
ncbi:phage shock protein C, PspC [Pseudopedobacter saltans DSM 12145]|uniref:Phage shock protein C, PspC n=1 Tax=Pseudopedobacter saltans (strain ATCC 51119 / DSM 12145 / JCM 21818 / CCUG 39354 / LMG 10337 / NBRC 100064 / NCIMB 13643) TaxID=762903 RepID=F0S957_PSESL|nr:PspC domain-containing protein [Pseudopedobacter saltans]ADY51355.1 phage shock protein C, PspC [Pseudopedobacter saltans DSM 12145]